MYASYMVRVSCKYEQKQHHQQQQRVHILFRNVDYSYENDLEFFLFE